MKNYYGNSQATQDLIELVPGYGVFLTRKQLDMTVANSSSATKLIRNLMMVFFEPQVLAASSALGTRKNKALDKDKVDACIRKWTPIIIYNSHGCIH